MTTPEQDPIPVNINNEPTDGAGGATSGNQKGDKQGAGKHAWVEEMEVAGSQLVEQVKKMIAEGNVRRLIIRSQDDKVMLEIPLTAGVVVGGVVTIAAPLLAALGALAALIAKVKIQVVRSTGDDSTKNDDITEV